MPVRISKTNISTRQGVFETNSSSMHSLVVLKGKGSSFPQSAEWEKQESPDGTYMISVGGNEFGRSPFAFLGEPIDKFLYLLADRYGRYSADDGKRNEFIDGMTVRLEGCAGFKFGYDSWYDRTDYGYVDHQSVGIVWNYIESNGIDEFDFIFDPHYVIIIDGDEYCTWPSMMQSGLIDADNISFDLQESRGD